MDGLSSNQVLERIREGKVNKLKTKPVTNLDIFVKHGLTLFNFVNLVLVVLCIITRQPKNALFIWNPIVNTAIAIFNDIRAKKMTEKLAIIATKKTSVIRDGKEQLIDNEEIVFGDIIKIRSGDQVVVDSVVFQSQIEVNEAFVTGESRSILKKKGDKVLSGSFVVSGMAYIKVVAVSENSLTNRISASARKIKADRSELFSIMEKIIKYVSLVLVPIGVLLYINQIRQTGSVETSVASMVSSVVSMIPGGLMLLTSSVLALATIRLGREKVLVSDLYAIETLARVDTICLDKTGTITTGNLKVEEIVAIQKHSEKEVAEIVSAILKNLNDENATAKALQEKFGNKSEIIAEKIMPFSSERKYSGINTRNESFVMGAYEFMGDYLTETQEYIELEHKLAEKNRVIAVARNGELIGFVLLRDEMRKNAKKLMSYFYQNDVDIKIISGDNVQTVEKVCKEAGIKSSELSIDLSSLKKKTKKDYRELVSKYTVFARVKPEEKQELIKALQDNGKIVAMTGDGVNDVLALKEANVGISVGSGADAARKVSSFVLLDDDFLRVPSIILQGRQAINNITRSSSLFLSKTVYAIIFAVVFIVSSLRYPFTPIEMSAISTISIGIPSVLLALLPNTKRNRTPFFKNILRNSVPAGILSVVSILIFVIISEKAGLLMPQVYMGSFIITMTIGILLVFKISLPLNKEKIGILALITVLSLIVIFVPVVSNFFGLCF